MSPAGAETGDWVLLGKVAGPHGIRGEIKVYYDSGRPEDFLGIREIFLSFGEDDALVPHHIEKSRVQGRAVLLKLKGIASRNDAEMLAGRKVWLLRRDLPRLKDGEYYRHDLVGKSAVTEKGRELGKVTGIFATGAHDILVVMDHGREVLVPVNKEFLVEFDENRVVLRLPPGLLDINKS